MKTKTYSPNYLSVEFALDRATVLRILKDVEPDGTEKGRPVYSTATFARALELHHAANASNNDGRNDGASDSSLLTQARVRIANASATAKERLNEVEAGKLCRVDGIANVFGLVVQVLHQSILSLPGKIADSLTPHSPFDRGEIMRKVQVETYEFMNVAQKGFAEITISAGDKKSEKAEGISDVQ
jgi:hypothetical protein